MCYGNIGYWKFVILAESVISHFFHAMALANLNSGHLLISLKGDATLKGKNEGKKNFLIVNLKEIT